MNKLDGRNLRSTKSQKLIIDAVIKLFQSGNFNPTAQEVSDESGIGIRTVFRQFDDMENLINAVDQEYHQKRPLMIKVDPNLTIKTRLKQIVETRNNIYSKESNIMMMTIFMSWKYKFLLKRYRNWQKFFRDETEKAIPELKKLDKQSQELVDAILSFAFWTRIKWTR
jgi:Bacterial regulatory proteins, tetR family.